MGELDGCEEEGAAQLSGLAAIGPGDPKHVLAQHAYFPAPDQDAPGVRATPIREPAQDSRRAALQQPPGVPGNAELLETALTCTQVLPHRGGTQGAVAEQLHQWVLGGPQRLKWNGWQGRTSETCT